MRSRSTDRRSVEALANAASEPVSPLGSSPVELRTELNKANENSCNKRESSDGSSGNSARPTARQKLDQKLATLWASAQPRSAAHVNQSLRLSRSSATTPRLIDCASFFACSMFRLAARPEARFARPVSIWKGAFKTSPCAATPRVGAVTQMAGTGHPSECSKEATPSLPRRKTVAPSEDLKTKIRQVTKPL